MCDAESDRGYESKAAPAAALQKTIKKPPVCGPAEYRELACHNFVTMFGIQH